MCLCECLVSASVNTNLRSFFSVNTGFHVSGTRELRDSERVVKLRAEYAKELEGKKVSCCVFVYIHVCT